MYKTLTNVHYMNNNCMFINLLGIYLKYFKKNTIEIFVTSLNFFISITIICMKY